MVIYFLRHLQKEYANNKGFDPCIVDDMYNIHNLPENPERIICSPFLRCRQSCKLTYPDFTPEISVNIREYLGHQKKYNKSSFDKTTWKYIKGEKIIEKDVEFYKRIKSFILNISFEKDTVIFTHGFCLFKIFEYFNEIKGFKITKFGKKIENGFKIDIFSE